MTRSAALKFFPVLVRVLPPVVLAFALANLPGLKAVGPLGLALLDGAPCWAGLGAGRRPRAPGPTGLPPGRAGLPSSGGSRCDGERRPRGADGRARRAAGRGPQAPGWGSALSRAVQPGFFCGVGVGFFLCIHRRVGKLEGLAKLHGAGLGKTHGYLRKAGFYPIFQRSAIPEANVQTDELVPSHTCRPYPLRALPPVEPGRTGPGTRPPPCVPGGR